MISRRVDHVNGMPSAAVHWPGAVPGRASRLWPALLPLPTVLLAGWIIVGWRFNGLYGQDPFAYFDYGVGALRRSILDGAPLTAMFWPLGYPILITLSSLVLGPITAAAQLVNVLAAGSCVYLTYLLGRDVLVRSGAPPATASRSAAIGALLLGVTGRLIESSVVIMADAVALATALLSAWALVRWTCEPEGVRGGKAWLALSSAALAWSIVTRWGQAVLILPWLVTTVATGGLRRLGALPWALVPAGVVLGVQIWLVFTVRPGVDLGPHPFAGDLALVQGSGSGWSLLHLFQRSFSTPAGILRYRWPNGLFYLTGPFLPEYLTPLVFPFLLLGGVVGAIRYRAAFVLLLSWPAALLLFDSGLAEQNPRFVLAALPPIAILAGLGSAVVWERVRAGARPYALGALTAGITVIIALGLRDLSALNRARNADLEIARWAASRVPERATTLSFGITLTLQHDTRLHVIDLSVLSPRDLRRVVAHRHRLYLVVQPQTMKGQFAAQPPGINFRSLQRDPGLAPIGTLHGYLLARVGST